MPPMVSPICPVAVKGIIPCWVKSNGAAIVHMMPITRTNKAILDKFRTTWCLLLKNSNIPGDEIICFSGELQVYVVVSAVEINTKAGYRGMQYCRSPAIVFLHYLPQIGR
jgi:hypothetical protein